MSLIWTMSRQTRPFSQSWKWVERNRFKRCWRNWCFCAAAYVSQKVSGELLTNKKNIYVDSITLFTPAMSYVIIQLHFMTGCDHNYGRGKKAVIKKLWEAPNIEFCYINAVTPFQFQLMHWIILKQIKYLCGIKKLGCAETHGTQWEKWKRRARK